MATRKHVNSHTQVKEFNNKRWICERVVMTASTVLSDWDFVGNDDDLLWKKIRPWKSGDLLDSSIAGQGTDDIILPSTNSYMNDGYVDDYIT